MFGAALQVVVEALQAPHPTKSRGRLDLERALTWKFILPIALLRKPSSANGTKAKFLQPIVRQCLNIYDAGDCQGLVRDYERDVCIAANMHRDDNRGDKGQGPCLV